MESGLFLRIYQLVALIPKGKVTTYGEIARALGLADSRIVGWALHGNKDSDNVPCHRVVNREGKMAPGYVFGGPQVQEIRLKKEGVVFRDDGTVDLERCLYCFAG